MSLFSARGCAFLGQLWRTNAPLTGVSLLMLPVLAASLLGLWFDPRSILGAPAWLKPAKFAVSIALYGLSLTWLFQYLPAYARTRSSVGWTTAGAFVIEMLIIVLQAARGTTSHFNVGTLLDGTLFTIMGLGILVQTLASVAVAVALWRQKFEDRALGWSLRLGLSIAILGGALGGLMTRPSRLQLEGMRAGQVSVVGAHTVGAPDGGPGVPGTGWSREHGDLRVPHFLGLHAVQVLPLLALGSRRGRWSEPQRLSGVVSAGASYVSLVGILLWQALRGQAVFAPDAVTAAALLSWLALTLALGWQALGTQRRQAVSPCRS